MDYSVRKLNITDTEGARFRVVYHTDISEVRATVSYDYAARDPFLAALREVTGLDEERFTHVQGTGMTRWYTDGRADR